MHDATARDLQLADIVGTDDFPMSDRPLEPHQRAALIERAARTQRLAFEQAQLLRPAVREAIAERDAAERTTMAPWLYEPAPGMAIIDVRNGEPYWGTFHVESIYYGAIGAADRARFNAIERAHRAALREDECRARQATWELTDSGRQALAEGSR